MSQGTLSGSASVSSSLMYNYLAATSVDASYPLASAEDAGGSPLLFSVGASSADANRKTLWVMLRDTTVQTGWRQMELSPDANHDVQSYAVIQAQSGEIILAVALDDGAGGSRVFVSPPLTPSTDGSAWSTLATAWVQRQGGPTGQPVLRLLLGDYVNAQQAPLLIAQVKTSTGSVGRYFIDASTSSVSSAWTNWAPPQEMKTLHDVVIGRASITGDTYRGTWTLYDDNSNKLNLLFTSLPDSHSAPHTLQVQAPSGARCLWALPDPHNSGLSALYVGGDGLSWFPSTLLNPTSPKPSTKAALAIASADLLPGVSAVLAHQDASRVSVWAVDSSQRLLCVSNAVGATDGWSAPLQQGQHVAHLAARRNQKRSACELFLSKTDNSTIAYLWQDPTSTSWQNTDLVLPSSGNGQQFACYTTVVRFTDAQGAPLINQAVQVSASEWAHVMVNGYWTDVDSTTPVAVKTDNTGTVTLINKVSDVGTPMFRFSAPFLAAPVTADPSAELRANLAQKLQSGDLSDWKKADGTPVVPPGTDPALVSQIQDSLNQLMANMGTLPADGSAAPVSSSAAPAPTTQALLVRPTSFSVLGDVGNAIETAAGDVLQALESAAGAVYEYVIQPIVGAAGNLLQFFVKIGEQVLTFVIRTISEALQLISWLFQQLAVLIGDLISLLGFLFAWDDILNTQKALEAMTADIINWVGGELKDAGPAIGAFFDSLIAGWDDVVNQAMGLQDVSLGQVTSQAQSSSTPEQQSAMACMTTSPGGTFSTYQLSHGGVTSTEFSPSENPLVQAVMDFTQTAVSILGDVAGTVKELLGNVKTMLQQGTFTLKGFLTLLAGEAVQALLQAARDLIVGMCAVAADITQAMVQDLLLRPVRIPLISWLYEELTDEDSLTMLGALSLLAAIPITIVYKLLTGEAPVQTQDVAQLKQADSRAKVMPWRANSRSFLELDAQTSGSKAQSEMTVRYSQIGGLASVFASFFYPIFLSASADAQKMRVRDGKLECLISTMQSALTAIGVAGSFPFDDDSTQQKLDRALWGFSLAEAVTTSCAALLGWAVQSGRGPTGALEVMEKLMGGLDTVLLGLVGLVGYVVAVWSYVLEMTSSASVPYHSIISDTEKLFANLSNDTGVVLESYAGLFEQLEVVPVAVGFDLVGFGLNALRWAAAVFATSVKDVEGKLFQLS
ncbi:hypothetical protein JY651_13245 [Pyxidicoccus parkwayensis]|uniref:Uncharacterized protein n=1 Tax=Pyxidicoccus parkwayensis TaxID=2813578 RepID=A0ABX7P5T2_9BACT|nr:hypothetical protein [Pyxidicoccus parkwaysis]QSQ25829.1 hypothetical protein JY651_13245 [Pyxidicoccus parkwaysis]